RRNHTEARCQRHFGDHRRPADRQPHRQDGSRGVLQQMSDAAVALREELRDAGLVDTHYHVGPELIVRRYDVKTLADKAVPFGATLVLKNHTYPTTPLASLARGHFGASFLGGVVLNNYVGGLNPQAVQGAHSGNRSNVSDPTPDPMPIVVWMPTVH